MTGEVEVEERVLVIRRIHVRYRLAAPPDARATVERVHEVHHRYCPVYRSLIGSIGITTSWELA